LLTIKAFISSSSIQKDLGGKKLDAFDCFSANGDMFMILW